MAQKFPQNIFKSIIYFKSSKRFFADQINSLSLLLSSRDDKVQKKTHWIISLVSSINRKDYLHEKRMEFDSGEQYSSYTRVDHYKCMHFTN